MPLAHNVKHRRKAFGFSQEELANACGVRKNAISRIERGVATNIHLTLLAALCLHLEVSFEELNK